MRTVTPRGTPSLNLLRGAVAVELIDIVSVLLTVMISTGEFDTQKVRGQKKQTVSLAIRTCKLVQVRGTSEEDTGDARTTSLSLFLSSSSTLPLGLRPATCDLQPATCENPRCIEDRESTTVSYPCTYVRT